MTFPVSQLRSEGAYWRAVELCLIEIFSMDEGDARRRVADLRLDLQGKKLHDPNIVYHDEPINLASDLAGKSLELTPANAEAYRKILKEVA